MKIAGHTLGTPGMTVPEALHLFHEAGLDAAEIIWQDDYSAAIPESHSKALVREIGRLASSLGLEVAGLTPYMSGYNSLDDVERERDLHRLSRCIDTAAELNCRHIRIYAGRYLPGDRRRDEKWMHLVESMQRAGEEAQRSGVILCVENHFNTMAVNAAETVALMKDVSSPGVGILYDQANLTFTHNESYEEAVPMQTKWIRYVHVKDLIFIGSDKTFTADAVERVKQEDRAVRSRIVGEGVLDWPSILQHLKHHGYDGYLSLEYEYRWHPQDLPEPQVGFKRSAETLNNMLAKLRREAL